MLSVERHFIVSVTTIDEPPERCVLVRVAQVKRANLIETLIQYLAVPIKQFSARSDRKRPLPLVRVRGLSRPVLMS